MNTPAPANLKQLSALLRHGEGPTLEFKRSTGELKEGCSSGMVLFGVRPDGTAEGQDVSDKTLREIAQALDRFEPPVNVPVERLPLGKGREVLILRVKGTSDSIPFTFEERPSCRLPSGVTLEQLSGPHASELRNPLIAEAFHRTGAVEVCIGPDKGERWEVVP